MPVRLSATDRIRTKIDALFAEDRELPEILDSRCSYIAATVLGLVYCGSVRVLGVVCGGFRAWKTTSGAM